MAATTQCAGCGHMVPSDARLCLRCGRPIAAPMVELERLDRPVAHGVNEGVVVEHRGPSGPRRPWLVGGALVVILVVAVFLLIGGDSDGSESDGGDTGQSTDEPTTTPVPTTEAPSAQSSTSMPTTTVAPGATTVRPVGAGSPAPVLGSDTGGLSLYVLSGRTLARVELDTGRVTMMERAFADAGGYVGEFRVVDGVLVVWRESGRFEVPADLSGPPVLDLSRDGNSHPGNRGLVYETDPRTGETTVRRADDPERSWRIPNRAGGATILGDEMLVQGFGRMYLVDTDGGVRPYAIGELVTSRDGWVLWRGCDNNIRCTYNLGDKDRPVVHNYELAEWEIWSGGLGQTLAPDAATVVAASRSGSGQPELIRLADGESLAVLDGNTVVDWTPDGSWAFVRTSRNIVAAISTRDGTSIPLDFRFPFDAQQLSLAVG